MRSWAPGLITLALLVPGCLDLSPDAPSTAKELLPQAIKSLRSGGPFSGAAWELYGVAGIEASEAQAAAAGEALPDVRRSEMRADEHVGDGRSISWAYLFSAGDYDARSWIIGARTGNVRASSSPTPHEGLLSLARHGTVFDTSWGLDSDEAVAHARAADKELDESLHRGDVFVSYLLFRPTAEPQPHWLIGAWSPNGTALRSVLVDARDGTVTDPLEGGLVPESMVTTREGRRTAIAGPSTSNVNVPPGYGVLRLGARITDGDPLARLEVVARHGQQSAAVTIDAGGAAGWAETAPPASGTWTVTARLTSGAVADYEATICLGGFAGAHWVQRPVPEFPPPC
jgi:hypothetical protein